jgi:predicted nucleotidyltransferase
MKALVIFGSTARNERSFDSDIDMLGVYDKEKILSVSKESVSLFYIQKQPYAKKWFLVIYLHST